MSRILDREAELARLEKAWSEVLTARKPQLAVVWGRRRVGKSFLLSHFVADKRSVFHAATEQAAGIELQRLYESVHRDLGADTAALTGGSFQSWEAALRFLVAVARDEPLAVVLDEVPYLRRSTPGFASVVQAVWDHVPHRTRLMLILTGSAVGTMESMIGTGGALRGRPTISMRMDPLLLSQARSFLRRLGPVELIEAYAASGGYPLHLAAWDQDLTTQENLLRLAFSPGGLLLEDARGMIGEELSDMGGYPRILAAIGRGRTRASEIANDAQQRIEYPLDVLVRSGLVRRSVPVGAPRRARPLYEVADAYLSFWFRVLYPETGLIEAGQGRAVSRRRRPQWRQQLGWVFEEAARAHASRLVEQGDLPDDLVVGRWWSTSGEPCEVDVLGLRGGATALLGESRWQERPLGIRELTALTMKLSWVPGPADDPLFALWGRGGVESGLRRRGVMGFAAADVIA